MISPPHPPLADDVVVLRPFSLADVDRVTEACQDPDIQRFTTVPSPYRRATTRWSGSRATRRSARPAPAGSLAITDTRIR